MAGRIPDETLQAIRDRVSLVDVVSAYVGLKRAGRNYLGLCPFHDEKTPSFTVSEERGLFHCFGCGAGGTVFNFVMRVERVEFPEAVGQLAKRAGVALPERGSDPAAGLRERIYAANELASRFFRQALASPAGEPARSYLGERGLRPETIQRYGLGYAPPHGAALASFLGQQRVPRDLMTQAGLVGRRDDGTIYDRFRGRVMFPIADRRARVIAFGGRTLGNDPPKYLNSPETPVFRKGHGLYGVGEAREAIRQADRVVLVEGYMDALLLVQEGIPYTVATLGTALTAAQLRLLQPLGGDQMTIFFFFDGDRAGRGAALRAFAVCAEAGVWGRAAFLPEGFDPDSYIRSHGSEATLALLEAAPPLADFYFDSVVPPGASIPQRTRAAEEVKRILATVRSDVQFELLARQAAQRLGVGEEIFRRGRRGATPLAPATPSPASPRWPAEERLLLEAMAVDAEVALWVGRRGTLALFGSGDLAEAGRRIIEARERRRSVAEVLDELPAPLRQSLTAILVGHGPLAELADRMKMAEDCVARVEEQAARRRRQAIEAELRNAQPGEARWRDALENLNQMLRREGGAT
jgi:DNA primase